MCVEKDYIRFYLSRETGNNRLESRALEHAVLFDLAFYCFSAPTYSKKYF